jgi:hypothetical protein
MFRSVKHPRRCVWSLPPDSSGGGVTCRDDRQKPRHIGTIAVEPFIDGLDVKTRIRW